MNPWAIQRKIIYLGIALVLFLILVILPVVYFLYQAPTCFDGKKNGRETGVDCGGECQLLCSFEGIAPIVLWSRAFKVTDGVYSVVAYIQNPNINSETSASYVFKLYDANNALIATKENIAFIPKNKILAVFEPNIGTQSKIPARVTFEFTEKLMWQKTSRLPANLVVTQKSISGETDRPRVDAVVENQSAETIGRIETVAIVYDDNQNAIAASRTFIDKMDGNESVNIVFTWLLPFATEKTRPSVVEIFPRVISDD